MERAVITWRGMGRGARELLAVGAYAFVFGVAFGIAARNVGMEGWAANLMSAAVFAGGSQFAVLELWQSPVAWGPLLIATLAVNGRHFLLGASLYPWLRTLPAWQVYLAAVLLSEPNWAKAIEAQAKGERDVGVLVGGGVLLWVAWVAGTVAGSGFIDLSPEHFRRFGLDLVFLTFLSCMLAGLRRGRADDLAWLAAGITALAAMAILPAGWHILAGAVAGGVVGVVVDARR